MKPWKFFLPFLSTGLFFAVSAVFAATSQPALALNDAVHLPKQSVAPSQTVTLDLPPLPSKPGKEIVLRFRIVCQTRTEGGCNYNAKLTFTGAPIGPTTAAGDLRLIGRDASFYLKGNATAFPIFSGDNLMVMFAPDLQRADAMATDGKGASYTLNMSDLARGVDGNTLSIHNNLEKSPFPGSGNLLVDDIEVGWVDSNTLTATTSRVPQRGAIARSVSADGIRLSQATGGGFRIDGNGLALAVETAVGMDPDTAPSLTAEDGNSGKVRPAISTLGPSGYEVKAQWDGLQLTRTLRLKDGLILWHDRWTNTSKAIRGVPFQYHFFLEHDRKTKFYIGGSDLVSAATGTAQNPTLFIESGVHSGVGLGITAESDWLRLLMEARSRGGVGGIFTRTLALAPGSSIDFDLSIQPVSQGGYWRFINDLRRRWGLNGWTMERPFYFSYAAAPDVSDPQERARKSLGHLGPLTVGAGGWLGLEGDARAVRSGAFGDASLPPQSPKASEEVDRFLTFEHRRSVREQFKKEVAAIHAACPDVKVVQKMHPAMEAVYRPLFERWPIQAEVIRTAEGKPFEDIGYSRAWLADFASRNWGVYYFVPRPGSVYLDELLRRETMSMDAGGDGIYCDEFSWAGKSRGYSRYDYSRWDGVSADLDADGKVVRLKSDNAHVTESAQLQIIHAALDRGKFFLGNGGAALRSVNSLHPRFFVEGGNGASWFPMAHLSATPLIFGNFGDRKTLSGVMAAVRDCLAAGTLYSPAAVNLLLKGPDNFVSKLYPMTVMEIGPGWIRGRERLATIHSGRYPVPDGIAAVQLYRYNAQGERLSDPSDMIHNPQASLELTVPKKGLLIAEFTPRGQ